MNIKKLNEAIAIKDHDAFIKLIGECTAKEAAILEGQCSADFAHMLWSGSVTWGFEVLWASEYMMPEDERSAEIDLPEAESLDWESPLKGLGLWAPQDQMARLGAPGMYTAKEGAIA